MLVSDSINLSKNSPKRFMPIDKHLKGSPKRIGVQIAGYRNGAGQVICRVKRVHFMDEPDRLLAAREREFRRGSFL